MAIQIQCAGCRRTLQVPAEHAGRSITCPGCRAPIFVPSHDAASTLTTTPLVHEHRIEASTSPSDEDVYGLAGSDSVDVPHTELPVAAPEIHAPPAAPPPPVAEETTTDPTETFHDETKVAKPKTRTRRRIDPASEELAREEASERRLRLIAALGSPVDRVRHSVGYNAALSAAAALMMLLPLAYICLVFLLTYFLYKHGTGHFGWIHEGFVWVLLYVLPLGIGAALIVLMLKPLMAQPPDFARRRLVTPKQQPLLHVFIEALCRTIHAPVPEEIHLDCRVGATAGFGRDELSGLVGRHFKVTIGLPLASGLTVRQFAAVVAQSMGHFSQHAGHRSSFFVRSINLWLQRVSSGHDEWDDLLGQWADEQSLPIVVFIVAPSRVVLSITRVILWIMMLIGHAASCRLLRQMELDADQYSIRLVGSKEFEATIERVADLHHVHGRAVRELKKNVDAGKLVDDFPALVSAMGDGMSEEIRSEIRQRIANGRTEPFDAIPSEYDRIAAARRLKTAGQFDLDAPASTLFSDFSELCRSITLDFYRSKLNRDISPSVLIPVHARSHSAPEIDVSSKAKRRPKR